MVEVDRKGTCHLIGCVGKGIHGPEGPHCKPSDPPIELVDAFRTYIDYLEQRIEQAGMVVGEALSRLRSPYVPWSASVRIGCADTFEAYERPLTDHCLGFPKVWSGGGRLFATCSIHPADWIQEWVDGTVISAGGLVDHHKAHCTNRRPT